MMMKVLRTLMKGIIMKKMELNIKQKESLVTD